MASVKLQIPVQAGLMEYLGSASLSENETLTFEFEREIVLEDVVIVASDTLDFDLQMFFPSSGQTAKVASPEDPTVSWMLNSADTSGGKQWYRLPARSQLILKKTNGSTLSVQMMALGRNA